jgi:hypothetical protein
VPPQGESAVTRQADDHAVAVDRLADGDNNRMTDEHCDRDCSGIGERDIFGRTAGFRPARAKRLMGKADRTPGSSLLMQGSAAL